MAGPWTERDDRRFALYAQGLIDREIAEVEGISRWSVLDWRRRLSLPPNDSLYIPFKYAGPAKQELGRERVRLIKQGWTDGDVGREQDRASSTIYYFRKIHGLPRANTKQPVCPAHGQKNYLPRVVSYEASFADRYLADPSWSNWLEEMGATIW